MLALSAAVPLLGGCGNLAGLGGARIEDANPLAWWRALEGGAIAEQRPDPPGADDPYPNLASVPARPVPSTPVQRRALTAQMVAERDGVRRDNAREPLVAAPVPKPAAPPTNPASVPPPMATLDAATAPPPAGSPPAGPPPATSPPAGPLPAAPPLNATPAVAAGPAAAPALLPARVPVPGRARPPTRAALPSGPIPDLPATPPPAPVLPGIPASTYAPVIRRPLPAVAVAFPRGSDVLPDGTAAAMQALVDRRGGGPVLVYAGGDASSGAQSGAAPDIQGPALQLALRRAKALGSLLAGAGVPPGQVRTQATALGRESGARLVD